MGNLAAPIQHRPGPKEPPRTPVRIEEGADLNDRRRLPGLGTNPHTQRELMTLHCRLAHLPNGAEYAEDRPRIDAAKAIHWPITCLWCLEREPKARRLRLPISASLYGWRSNRPGRHQMSHLCRHTVRGSVFRKHVPMRPNVEGQAQQETSHSRDARLI
jgi:hypothetical protein